MSTAQTENLNFCDALRAIKAGKRAQRAGWNGKGLFAFLQPGSVHGPYVGFELDAKVPADHPSTIDGVSMSLFNVSGAEETAIRYPQLCLSFPTGTFGAWAPSQTDVLASDWKILEDVKEEPSPAPEGKRQGVITISAKEESAVTKALAEHGAVIIKRELYDMRTKVILIIEHADLDLVMRNTAMPRYMAVVNDHLHTIEFRKVDQ